MSGIRLNLFLHQADPNLHQPLRHNRPVLLTRKLTQTHAPEAKIFDAVQLSSKGGQLLATPYFWLCITPYSPHGKRGS
jgi:hypothetical protein